MENIKSIGIIGGMGPQASAKLLEVMVFMCTNDFGIKIDSDFPEIILDSVPVPNFISNKSNSKKALRILKSRVKMLEVFNPSCLAISCNTAHILLPKLQEGTKIPFVSIIKEVAFQVSKANLHTVGLLASPTTISSHIYQNALEIQNVRVVVPTAEQTRQLELIIRAVLAGKTTNTDIERLVKIAKSLEGRGAQGIVLGCTELPLVFPKAFKLPVFDSIEILASGLLHKAISV